MGLLRAIAFVVLFSLLLIVKGFQISGGGTNNNGLLKISMLTDDTIVYDSEGSYKYSDFKKAQADHELKLTDLDQMNCALYGECPVPESFLGGPQPKKQIYADPAQNKEEYTVFTMGGDYDVSVSGVERWINDEAIMGTQTSVDFMDEDNMEHGDGSFLI
mmetsp:Transcript_21957/g.38349  ORF Transcript_21957/g.38349 Transcript_21957/m.38349 type:complete len:160 (-) Transcript_21957:45-524(-)